MAEARIARKHFLQGLAVAAAACVAVPARAVTSRVNATSKASKNGAADLPFKVRPAAKIVARPALRA